MDLRYKKSVTPPQRSGQLRINQINGVFQLSLLLKKWEQSGIHISKFSFSFYCPDFSWPWFQVYLSPDMNPPKVKSWQDNTVAAAIFSHPPSSWTKKPGKNQYYRTWAGGWA
jgi:hypothetical protein